MGHVNNGRDAGSNSRENVDDCHMPFDSDPCVPRTFRRMTDRVESATETRAMQQPAKCGDSNDQNEKLRWNDTKQMSLAQKQKLVGKTGIVFDTAGQSFGYSAKEREGTERDDQRWKLQPRNHQSVQASAESSSDHSRRAGNRYRHSCVTP